MSKSRASCTEFILTVRDHLIGPIMRQILIVTIVLLSTISQIHGKNGSGTSDISDSTSLYYTLRIDFSHLNNAQEYMFSYTINSCLDDFSRKKVNSKCYSYNKVVYNLVEIESGDIPLIDRVPIDTVSKDVSPEILKRIFELSRCLFGVEDSIDIYSRPEIYDMHYDGSYAVVGLELPGSATWFQTQISFAVETRYQLGLKKILELFKEIENGL
jgi:hypothetical protein